MNDFYQYRHAQDHVQDMQRYAANERLVRLAATGQEPSAPFTVRAALWIGKEMIAAGTMLKTKAECRVAPADL